MPAATLARTVSATLGPVVAGGLCAQGPAAATQAGAWPTRRMVLGAVVHYGDVNERTWRHVRVDDKAPRLRVLKEHVAEAGRGVLGLYDDQPKLSGITAGSTAPLVIGGTPEIRALPARSRSKHGRRTRRRPRSSRPFVPRRAAGRTMTFFKSCNPAGGPAGGGLDNTGFRGHRGGHHAGVVVI
jgi:hypothetical protein